MFDIELTNRCNAHCSFCPRDRTPHEGLMSGEVFSAALSRIVEYRAEVVAHLGSVNQRVSLCGLGDVLVHPRAVQAVASVRAAGIWCQLNTNAALLDEAKGRALLAAGLQQISLNIGATGDEYEAIYDLPFERTLENVVRFRELATGRCHIIVVLVGDREERGRLDEAEAFWRRHGFEHFRRPVYVNRGGALADCGSAFADESAQARASALLARRGSPRCGVPVLSMFIGYDGYYYLCSSDWEKVSSHGHVFEHRIVDAMRSRLRHVASRGAPCDTCTVDPVNRVAAALANDGVEAAEREADNVQQGWTSVRSSTELIAVLQADPETVALTPHTVTTVAEHSPTWTPVVLPHRRPSWSPRPSA
jgi:MoaA/NifB/PqqE/SkfB family radical SAM enzyme